MKNDERILKLRQQIEDKEKKIKSESKTTPLITNAICIFEGETYNLHVATIENLLRLILQLNLMRMSANDLQIDIPLVISGFNVNDWITDIKNILTKKQLKEEMQQLDSMKKKLESLLSEDKKTEIELDAIELLL